MVYHNSFRQSRGEGVVKFIELKFFNFVWWERLSSKDISGPGCGPFWALFSSVQYRSVDR